MEAAAPEKGETVLVSGATGGAGALAVQLAAARGARVIATARPGTDAAFAASLTGTDVAVVDYAADLDAQVRALAPEGVDVVLHLVGDAAQLVGLLREGGRIASTPGLTQEAVETDGVTVHPIMADLTPKTPATLAVLAAAGELRVPVTATFPLERASEAFDAFRTGTLGKITVTCACPLAGPRGPDAAAVS
ncbi:zinc-binding dehydrogenase [Streptosporangium minutum]|uniref:zinc-binding dehydrogenase n=1 Tax=Streptosporangium minutum TaxID=569862 RepID=UPI001A996925|nr:zinc-binding dehydrogenase [Streptosporangium minutum]